VGRRADNTVRIDHITVSAHHAELVNLNGSYVIRDLKSTNHSYIEGVKFIEAELDRPCKLVLGTVECDYLPDPVDTAPEELDSLRKTVGLLRRQNDELVMKIAEQQNQIDILGTARLFTPAAGAKYESLQEQVKTLTAENESITAEVKVLRSIFSGHKTSSPPKDARGSPAATEAAAPAERVIVSISESDVAEPPRPHAMIQPAVGDFQKIALLTEKLGAWISSLAAQPGDTKGFGVILQLVDEMNKEATALGATPVSTIVSNLESLLTDAGLQPGPVSETIIHTAAQSVEFLGKLLTEDVLSRATNLAPSRVIAVDGDKDLLPAIVASLQFANLATIGCSDAQDALHTLHETHCNLILMDVGLPDLNERDICARIRALPKHDHTPIVFLTGQDSTMNRQLGTLNGASDFIGKPFNMFELTLKAHTWALKNQLAVA